MQLVRIAVQQLYHLLFVGDPSIHEEHHFLLGVIGQSPPCMCDHGGAAPLSDEDAVLELHVAEILPETLVVTRIVRCVEHKPGERRQIEFPDVVEAVRNAVIGPAEQDPLSLGSPHHLDREIPTPGSRLVQVPPFRH